MFKKFSYQKILPNSDFLIRKTVYGFSPHTKPGFERLGLGGLEGNFQV